VKSTEKLLLLPIPDTARKGKERWRGKRDGGEKEMEGKGVS